MSLQRLGRNSDGSRHIVYDEPARARVSGYGGSLVSMAITPKKAAVRPIAGLYRGRSVCGAPLGINQFSLGDEVCARTPGHVKGHRSADALAHATAARRTNRPLGGIR